VAYAFPKRILEEGFETQIDKINNTCRRTILEEVKGVLKDEYEEVLKDPGELFPFISATGNKDVVNSNEFYREDEKKDERIGQEDGENVEVEDVTDTHVEEPAVVARRGKRNENCFVNGRLNITVVQKEMAEFKQAMSQIPGPSDTMGKNSASEIPCPSATMGKDQDKSSQSLCPAATKEKGKGKVDESVVPPTVRRSPRQGRKPGDWRTPTLKDMELPEDRVNDEDYSLVFVPEDSWAKLIHWCSTTKQ
ncbi:hypothetical protein HID58_074990, partial [Brassica napus]